MKNPSSNCPPPNRKAKQKKFADKFQGFRRCSTRIPRNLRRHKPGGNRRCERTRANGPYLFPATWPQGGATLTLQPDHFRLRGGAKNPDATDTYIRREAPIASASQACGLRVLGDPAFRTAVPAAIPTAISFSANLNWKPVPPAGRAPRKRSHSVPRRRMNHPGADMKSNASWTNANPAACWAGLLTTHFPATSNSSSCSCS